MLLFKLSKTISKYFLVLFISSCSISCVLNDIEDGESSKNNIIYNEFSPLWKLYLESSNGGWQNNDIGRFSHDDSPAILALLELYKLTGDERYLTKLIFLIDKILQNDDISRGLADDHRGGIIYSGWSSTRYTLDNSRTIFLMGDALILISILKSYNYLMIKNEFNIDTSSWLKRAEKEFNLIFEKDWVNFSNDMGFFQDNYFDSIGLNMPMNQYAVVGELCLELYLATGNSLYKDYSVKTGNYLKAQMIEKEKSFVWYYKLPSVNYPEIRYDDFSHSQLVWRFIHSMYQSDLIFDEEYINKIVGTFRFEVMDGEKVFFYFGGKLNENKQAPQNYLHKEFPWLEYFYSLAEFDNSTKEILIKFRQTRILEYNPDSNFNHIGQFVLLDFAFYKKYLN